MDGSVQMMNATTQFWGQVLRTELNGRPQSFTSTAAPWWKVPEPARASAPAMAGLPFMSPAEWMPWLKPTATTAPAAFNPVELWQRMWLPTTPFAAFGFGTSMAPGLWPAAAAPSWPWQPAEQPQVMDPWQPVATAYRTANGHAMAAVLRTMAHVVEPKPHTPTMTDFWPNPFITRH